MENIGTRLVHLRKKVFNMNQKQFSPILGITQGALSEIENGNRGLPADAIIKLLELSLAPDTLFSIYWLLTGKGLPSDTNATLFSSDEQELLNGYRQLDNRGQHTLHAVLYQELDRINEQKD